MATFGECIAEARRKKGLNQRQVVQSVRKDDGSLMSTQYLSDIERGRRNPPSNAIVEQLANTLNIDLDYLLFLTGRLPSSIKGASDDPDVIKSAVNEFRRHLRRRVPLPSKFTGELWGPILYVDLDSLIRILAYYAKYTGNNQFYQSYLDVAHEAISYLSGKSDLVTQHPIDRLKLWGTDIKYLGTPCFAPESYIEGALDLLEIVSKERISQVSEAADVLTEMLSSVPWDKLGHCDSHHLTDRSNRNYIKIHRF